MSTLEAAYKILYALEHKGAPEYMGKILSPMALGIETWQYSDVIKTLLEESYITGVSFRENVIGEEEIDIKHARITLKGAQYLKENSAMALFAKTATNVISVAKGLLP